MATKNEDGSVTLTAQEFRCCAAFLELPANELLAFLSAQGTQEGFTFTTKDLVKKIMQHHQIVSCATDGLAN